MSAVAIGFGLLVWGGILRWQLEKEVKHGRIVLWNNFLPYWNKNDFTEKGNKLRKSYNKAYFIFLSYIAVLFILKHFYVE